MPEPPHVPRAPNEPPQEPKTPRDSVANAVPVHIDDALAKRVRAALALRPATQTAYPESSQIFTVLHEVQEALASSRGMTAELRHNYQELYASYQECTQVWREKCAALEAAATGGSGEDKRRQEYATTLAACEAFQNKQRLELEGCQKELEAARQAAKEAALKERAATEQAVGLKGLLTGVAEELRQEQAVRAAAQDAAKESEATLHRERAVQEERAASSAERARAAEARAVELEKQLQSHGVSSAQREADGRQLVEEAAQLKASHRAHVAEASSRLERLEAELATQTAEWKETVRLSDERALTSQAQCAAAEKQAAEQAAVSVGAIARVTALSEELAVVRTELTTAREELKLAREEREELQRKFLLQRPSGGTRPSTPPPPPPPAAPLAGTAQYALQALRSELDGWKMVAEQAEQVQQRVERELKAAKSTIASMRAAAERAGAEDKENGAGCGATAGATLNARPPSDYRPDPPSSKSASAARAALRKSRA